MDVGHFSARAVATGYAEADCIACLPPPTPLPSHVGAVHRAQGNPDPEPPLASGTPSPPPPIAPPPYVSPPRPPPGEHISGESEERLIYPGPGRQGICCTAHFHTQVVVGPGQQVYLFFLMTGTQKFCLSAQRGAVCAFSIYITGRPGGVVVYLEICVAVGPGFESL